MTWPDVSVIIPCFNKRGVLALTLDALSQQDVPAHCFEVILVDDGSSDGTREWLLEQDHTFALQVLDQAHKGAGAARNLGASQAVGRLLLFLDADIVAARNLLQAHLHAHDLCKSTLVVGRVLPWPVSGRLPAHDVFSQSFDFGPEGRCLSAGFGLTQNLSVKASDFAVVGGFDEGLPRGQDIAFVYRATNSGFELYYQPQALAYHNHVMTLDGLCAKIRRDHAKLVLLFQKHPELVGQLDYLHDKWPIQWGTDAPELAGRKMLRRFLATAPLRYAMHRACGLLECAWPNPILLDFLVWKVLASYQLLGLREGMEKYGWRP